MKVGNRLYRTIWPAQGGVTVEIIDQTMLPHEFSVVTLRSLEDAAHAIAAMQVRGAPLIGAAAAYGLALGLRADASDAGLETARARLRATRPTAVNLAWALDRVGAKVRGLAPGARAEAAFAEAQAIADEDAEICKAIGGHGRPILERISAANRGRPVNVLTHCNAGWLATVDWGTALAPVYAAHDAGIPVHVWVDETRPRNQGASLTAWELAGHGVAHTVISDNAGGHLMREGRVDVCIVGTDRTAANGDVCNKIGTYLKALAAADNGVPFYVGAPGPSIDFAVASGAAIPIEERPGHEVSHIHGRDASGKVVAVRLTPNESPVANPAFDVTPARLVTGLITERGVCPASAEALAKLFPDRADAAWGLS
jgi:methylthioribose-1-phosphate isomerase